jgi:hypothetical protein
VLVASPKVMELDKLYGVEVLLALRRYGALPQSAA